MNVGFAFFAESILLGVGLAMDAFSVSLANGLNEPYMGRGRMTCIAGIFAFFQFAMPMTGWVCVCAPSCPALCNPADCSLPGSSVRGISQARILK